MQFVVVLWGHKCEQYNWYKKYAEGGANTTTTIITIIIIKTTILNDIINDIINKYFDSIEIK